MNHLAPDWYDNAPQLKGIPGKFKPVGAELHRDSWVEKLGEGRRVCPGKYSNQIVKFLPIVTSEWWLLTF